MINKMIADIKQESDDETEHKAYCEAELHTNEMATTDNDNLLKDLQAQVTLARLSPFLRPLRGSFSAVSTPIFAIRDSFCNIL